VRTTTMRVGSCREDGLCTGKKDYGGNKLSILVVHKLMSRQ